MTDHRSTVAAVHRFTPRFQPRRENRYRRGHTLVETLIVMAVIAALAGIAAPRLNYQTKRLDGNVQLLRGLFQRAWRTSVQKQHDILVSLDTVNRRVRVLEDLDNDGVADVGERASWMGLQDGARFDVPATGLTGPVTASVSGSGVRSVESMPTIIFRRNGSTSGDAELYLSIQNKAVKEFRGLTVAQATGRTEWFRRVNSAWWRSGGI